MRSNTASLRAVAFGAVLLVGGAACGGGGGGNHTTTTPPGGTSSLKGGTYRTAIEDFGFTGAFDPTGEYLGTAWGLYSDLLLRTLVTYNHVVGLPGDSLVPDIAQSMPQVSSDGLTYTFQIKQGVKFGPPLNRQVTSKDIEYAFRRIDTKALVAQYGFYYDGTIQGMDGPQAKMPADISGIDSSNPSTIVFHLQKPTGDLLYRLAMPATSPFPEEVAKCFTKAGDYGRDVIATGPYMIKGEDKLNTSSCSTIKPISGFDPTKFMTIVRNPAYDPSTDSPTDRENNVDGVNIVIDTNTSDIFDKIAAGELDGSWASVPPPEVLQNYLTDPNLKPNLHADPGDRTWYITMNVLAPPFDDVHVRRAVNYVINKAALLQAIGGPTYGTIATHIMPPTVLDFGGENYDPYASANESGDLAKAKQEMSQSKYDKNHDGKCDSSVCNNVLFVNRNIEPFTKYTPIIQSNLASLGINVKVRELDTSTAYTTIQTVKNLVPIAANAGWGKDYADPSTFAVLFDSSGISCEGQINYSEIGMDAKTAKSCGSNVLAAYNAAKAEVPNADSEISKCNALSGDQRTACWVQFDKDLMEKIVPWVPYRWANAITVTGSSVSKYEFDQFAGAISFCNIAVNNKLNPNNL